MNWYKRAQKFSKPSPDWFEKGAIFGYTETDSLKSQSVYLPPEIAATWNQKNGINHEEVFGMMQNWAITEGAFTWIYDIGKKKLDGYGFDIIPHEVKSAALAEAQTKTTELK